MNQRLAGFYPAVLLSLFAAATAGCAAEQPATIAAEAAAPAAPAPSPDQSLSAITSVEGQPAALVDPAAAQQDFANWLASLRAEAGDKGISTATIDAAFSGVEQPIPRVLQLDRSQPEFVQTFSRYMSTRMSDRRIQRGKEMMVTHKELFDRIEQQYGVQPQYLTAFWALESNFGGDTGGFSVVNALATLAWDPRRAAMFRRELLTALQIIEDGHIAADKMTGSWAGAMGQCQFMPSIFSAYAVDGDGDGIINIWTSIPDVLSSAAHFLSESGWKGDERWGREVVLPENFDFALSGTGIRKTVTEWDALGIRRVDGSALGQADMQASVIVPAGADGPAFLAYDNFRTTMVWNRSTFYAISVGHLADRFMGEGPIRYMPATEERSLAKADVEEMQTLLNQLGVDAGTPDGVLGTRTREAVREYQLRNQMKADGYPSHEVLELLRNAATSSQ
ncbi:MAG: lytic murein transglycosylase [Pseudomonadota bacterium]